ncbi:MAG: AAA family ATPase [Candidatus Thermoplasmatota archaeon]|nr:AAA family ATPase [Euryarchaeota archaeon]MBU4032047.1 AAA family ATPase [Candidatus Thermoplasmatota archaeon]MBU4070685.1 AAA family ATPase [Candidatus Thermoplasmatota archaeon]MBU4143713.1 AAA family ATPase [Candidatus Thermoplasmatota archaeon]MBU4592396.1 AAA family ATPase [Candidatus Thermoplasmatota archaeon]
MIKTYIDGFDEALGGGIPEGHTVLISGTPGTMKSSICLNLLYKNHINAKKKSLYISLEETKDSLLTGMEKLSMRNFNENDLFIVDLAKLRMEYDEVDQMQDWLRFVTEYLTRRVKEDRIDIVAIDSLTALYSLIELEKPRQQLFQFFGFLKKLGVTSFLISEMIPGSEAFGPYREDFLADGNIMLKLHEVGDTDIQLRIRCVKMRHVKHERTNFVLMHRGDRFMITSVLSE